VFFSAIAAALFLSGCRGTDAWKLFASHHPVSRDELEPPEPPVTPDDEPTVATDASTTIPSAFKELNWTRATPDADGKPPQRHWQNRVLEPIAKRPGFPLRQVLSDANAIIRGNAAILLGSKGDENSVTVLAKSIRLTDDEISAAMGPPTNLQERSAQVLAFRCATAESLGNSKHASAREAIRKLSDEALSETMGPAPFYTAELHAELIAALGKQFAAGAEPRITKALESKDPKVRLEAVLAWQKDRDHPLPSSGKELRMDTDPNVRAAALKAIAVHHDPDACDILRRGVNDTSLSVRVAAVIAFAELENEEAREELRKLRHHSSEALRTAAVTALASLGADAALYTAIEDKSWRVRQALADSLAAIPRSADDVAAETQSLAKDLVKDLNSEVQKHAVAALQEWPLPQAGPVLLTAMASTSFAVRRDAAKQLAQRWPAAADFPYDASAGQRATALARLEAQFASEVGPLGEVVQAAAQVVETARVSAERLAELQKLLRVVQSDKTNRAIQREALAALKQFGPDLVAALDIVAEEQLGALPEQLFTEILPEINPLFIALAQLQSRDVAERRRGASELVRVARDFASGRLPAMALSRLAQVTQTETDPVIWQAILTLVQSDPRRTAAELAVVAAGNASAEVRRQAAAYFAAHPDDKRLQLITALLDDPATPVVIEAVRAIAVAETLKDPAPLLSLLASPDVQVRIEVAAALAQHRLQQGTDTLVQLAQEADADVRRRVAKTMGQVPNAAYLPALMVLLSDRSDIRAAALGSLPSCANHTIGADEQLSSLSQDEQARRWRVWFDSR
jgi:HEAT repeat protein